MTLNDSIGLVSSYVYAFALLLVVERVGKACNWAQFFTRKIIHIGAGMWVWGALLIFDNWYLGIVPFATFIVLNYVFYKKQTFDQMDDSDSSPGTVYFAMSITLLLGLFWRHSASMYLPIAVAALMTMTIGDAAAALIGRYYGKKRFKMIRNTKTVLGSLAMLVFSFLAILCTFVLFPVLLHSYRDFVLTNGSTLVLAILGAIAATVAEAFSPSGSDNLTVPLFTVAVLYLLI